MARQADRHGWVGPVLQSGATADAVIAAIREENAAAEVIDRGSYVRVLAPGSCRVTRARIEAHAGRAFRLPVDLEMIMTSFNGKLVVSEECVLWYRHSPGGEP